MRSGVRYIRTNWPARQSVLGPALQLRQEYTCISIICMYRKGGSLVGRLSTRIATLARAPRELIGPYIVEPQRVGVKTPPAHHVARQ